jgi:hypothetical protein
MQDILPRQARDKHRETFFVKGTFSRRIDATGYAISFR